MESLGVSAPGVWGAGGVSNESLSSILLFLIFLVLHGGGGIGGKFAIS